MRPREQKLASPNWELCACVCVCACACACGCGSEGAGSGGGAVETEGNSKILMTKNSLRILRLFSDIDQTF